MRHHLPQPSNPIKDGAPFLVWGGATSVGLCEQMATSDRCFFPGLTDPIVQTRSSLPNSQATPSLPLPHPRTLISSSHSAQTPSTTVRFIYLLHISLPRPLMSAYSPRRGRIDACENSRRVPYARARARHHFGEGHDRPRRRVDRVQEGRRQDREAPPCRGG